MNKTMQQIKIKKKVLTPFVAFTPTKSALIELRTRREGTVATLFRLHSLGIVDVTRGQGVAEEYLRIITTSLARRRLEADQIITCTVHLQVFQFVDSQTFNVVMERIYESKKKKNQ
jgi:hypothetical protein